MCKYPGNCSLSKGVKVEISLFKGQRLECAGLCRTGIRSQALFVEVGESMEGVSRRMS